MLIYVYFIIFFELVIGQKTSFRRGNRYSAVPYYSLGPKPENGVGVLQDLSNARILSNEPFIISFEFPKLIGSGDSRKNRFGSKRTKSQRKKNRKPREFRYIDVPEEPVLERRKRLQILDRSSGLENLKMPHLITDGGRMGKSFVKTGEDSNPTARTSYGRIMNFETETKETEDPVQVENQTVAEESVHKNWENIKKKWASLFAKNKEEEDNQVDGGDDKNEERLKAMSRKMWANCQLLKLLKAPQRNPYFYKLLPPNYPALIMNEEKQLKCNQFYDVIDLAKDKKMIADKIDQLERILSSGNDSALRRKREVSAEEFESEGENTLQDESLQGKSEGEVRSDRSKRTKERQHIRKQRSKEAPKKTRRLHRNSKKSALGKSEKQEKVEVENVKRSRRKDGVSETPTKTRLEADLKPEKNETEKKREKQDIKTVKDNSLQDVFSPSEVNKVIRQKEMEANIFDKVLRVMNKFEDNNPYDESFRPQKRESGNNTETIVEKKDSSEEGWELEDTIKKLAKIFKMLGVKAEASKKKAEGSEENSSGESNEDEIRQGRVGKSPKCTCAECPFCQDCYKCFKECRKAVMAAKNPAWNNQTPVTSPQVSLGKDANSEQDSTNGVENNSTTLQEERSNNAKLERMYRSKLPPSRDLVRVYFDNPENKLLVWTKRGRRTMPWAPLTSDLQLYRDRARQILKSAEDILHRIRETEDKIHSGQYDGNNQELNSDKTESVKNVDDIIEKVVNEDETKNILRTPWEAELEKGVLNGNVVKSNQMSKNSGEETTYNIFKDGIREKPELTKESVTTDNAEVGKKQTGESWESAESYEVGRVEAAEPKTDIRGNTESAKEEVDEENTDIQVDNKSVEAAVLPIDVQTVKSEKIHLDDYENGEHIKDVEDSQHREKVKDEEEDVPAKVEAVNEDNSVPVEALWKPETEDNINIGSQTRRKQIIEYKKKPLGKPENVQGVTRESETTISDEVENVKKSNVHELESAEESDNKSEVEMWYNRKSELEKETSEESEETESQVGGKSAEREKSYSAESEQVEKAHDEESEEKEVYSKESGEVERAINGKSEEMEEIYNSEEVERAYNKESEADETYSDESESAEKVRGSDSESEDVERSVEKTEVPLKKITKQGETNKGWQLPADMEKNAEKIKEELKKVVMMEDEQITNDKQNQAESAEVEKVEKSKFEKGVTGGEIPSYEDAEEVERKETDPEEDSGEESEHSKERDPPEIKVKGPEVEEKHDFEDHIKSIEENYIIKGVKQTKEEKEAILKALLNAEKKEGGSIDENIGIGEALTAVKDEREETAAVKNPTKTVESGRDSLKMVVQHLERGQMDEKDFDVIKNLDESQVDLLVGEMQKNDEKGAPVNCETRMKLCQAVCSCSNNGTDSDLNKYEIIKGFLGWLKDLKMENMVPIST